jgi:hypothetical protein
MEIPVLLEPTPAGYRASTHAPVPLSGEGETEDAAMAALSNALQARLQGGGQLRTLQMLDLSGLQEITARMRSNPMYPEFEKAIEEYRQVANAVPDPDAD